MNEREYQMGARSRKQKIERCEEALRILKDQSNNGYHEGFAFQNLRETVLARKRQLTGTQCFKRREFNHDPQHK